MREHGRRGHRRIAALAAIVIAVGLTQAATGVATAATRPNKFVVVRLDPSAHQVTLQVPTPSCVHSPPGCVWLLAVDQPFTAGDPHLGMATGTSGLLTVTYPAAVCGVVQGDAEVTVPGRTAGSERWRYKVGHRIDVPCPPGGSTTPAPTTPPTHPTGVPTTTTGTTGPQPLATATTQPPFSGGTSSSSTGPTTHAVETAAVTQLPFTGIDLKLLVLIGTALVLAGLLLASRRRALRRLQVAALVQRERASRASRWFLGL